MTKTQLENTKDDEKWWGNNQNTRMPTRYDEIATNNNRDIKDTLETP
jgi:hypothetical protein